MSRRREEQRQKKRELERQLGDADVDADDLRDRARVSRPVLRVIRHAPRGIVARLRKQHLVLALYLVDSNGAHLLGAPALDEGEHRFDKITYHRPAHFVLVAAAAHDPAEILFGPSLKIDGHAVADKALASEAWETPRSVTLDGVRRGVALSVRGVGRATARHELELESSRAIIEIEI